MNYSTLAIKLNILKGIAPSQGCHLSLVYLFKMTSFKMA